jgi:hypothetical protein
MIALAASCKISDPESDGVHAGRLTQYSCNLFNNYITAPVEITEMLIKFDEYLLKSDDDKKLDRTFYGNIEEVFDNIYRFKYTAEIPINCTIDTKGKSLSEGVWEFADLYIVPQSYSVNQVAYTYQGSYWLPESTLITMTDKEAKTYVMSYEGLFETTMKYLGDDNGRDSWEVTARGETIKEKDLYASFSTGSQPLNIKERPIQNYTYNGNSYDGHFYVEFMRDDRKLDDCEITFRHGFTTKYKTSRD